MAIVTPFANSKGAPEIRPPSIFDIAGRPSPVVRPFNGGNPPLVMFNWNGQLVECSLKAASGPYQNYGTISFPVEECSASFSQDIVQHKRPNVPGARIESTGFNPITFKIKAPFLFGLQRGKGETWGDLYPGTFSQIFQMLTDKVAPVLVFTHPTMGKFSVKPQGGSTTVSGAVRNGQILDFDLVQANEDDTSLSNITDSVALGDAISAATLFDNTVVLLVPPPPPSVTAISLTKLLQNIRGIIDSTSLFINQVTNAVIGAINQVKMIQDALKRLKTAATSGLMNQLERIKAGLHSLLNNQSLTLRIPPAGRSPAHPLVAPPPATPPTRPPSSALVAAQIQAIQALNSSKQILGVSTAPTLGVYVVAHNMTLAAIAHLTKNRIDTLLKLNPAISKSPTITIGTQVVYQATTGPSPRQ